jgi:hypothetical protein
VKERLAQCASRGSGRGGDEGYTAIAGSVKDVPPPVLADLYLRAGAG